MVKDAQRWWAAYIVIHAAAAAAAAVVPAIVDLPARGKRVVVRVHTVHTTRYAVGACGAGCTRSAMWDGRKADAACAWLVAGAAGAAVGLPLLLAGRPRWCRGVTTSSSLLLRLLRWRGGGTGTSTQTNVPSRSLHGSRAETQGAGHCVPRFWVRNWLLLRCHGCCAWEQQATTP